MDFTEDVFVLLSSRKVVPKIRLSNYVTVTKLLH